MSSCSSSETKSEKLIDPFMITATEINKVLKCNNMKLSERQGQLFLVDKHGVKVELKSLFRVISREESTRNK